MKYYSQAIFIKILSVSARKILGTLEFKHFTGNFEFLEILNKHMTDNCHQHYKFVGGSIFALRQDRVKKFDEFPISS